MDYSKIDEENEKYQKRLHDEAIKAGGSNKDLALATMIAKQSSKENKLMPDRDEEGEYIYSIEQGAKAACHAREDAAATLIIQKTQLDLLYNIKTLLSICIFLLAYIAYKVY